MDIVGHILRSQRIVIIGNSGSGKSTLANHLAARLGVPAVDLDHLHWEDEGYGRKRDEAAARGLVAEAAAEQGWIVEGVYGWLAEIAIPRARALIWLDFAWSECRASLIARGARRGADLGAFDELLRWAEAYATRTTSSSFEGHRRMFEDFAATKLRLRSRKEIDDFLAKVAGEPIL
jgi:adenylate kinase family enzyme